MIIINIYYNNIYNIVLILKTMVLKLLYEYKIFSHLSITFKSIILFIPTVLLFDISMYLIFTQV